MSGRWPVTTIVLALLNAWLLAAIGWQLARGSQTDVLLQTQARQNAVAPLRIDMPRVPVDLNAIQSQVVFYPSRSFYVAPVVAVQTPPPDYRFAGSMSLPNAPVTATLIHNQTGARTKVAVGEQLDGWLVAEIGARRVLVQLGERSAEIVSAAGPRAGAVAIVANQPPSSLPSGIVRVPVGTPAPRAADAAGRPAQPAPVGNTGSRLYRPPGS